jgi:ABC transport system ATP-binding/permease protein
MNEILLNAILNIFAIQTSLLPPGSRAAARAIIEEYLSRHLRIKSCETYLALFDEVLEFHDAREKAALLQDVGAIAARLRALLPRFEQHMLLLRYIELASRFDDTRASTELAESLATALAIEPEEVDELRVLCSCSFDRQSLTSDFLVHLDRSETAGGSASACKYLERADFDGRFAVLRLPDVGANFIVAGTGSRLTLDSLPLPPGAPRFLQPGSVLRDAHGARIYSGEIEAELAGGSAGQRLVFCGDDLEYRHPGGEVGLRGFSFSESSSRMVGIMGVSGAGKSTLLNVLSGQSRPSAGTLSINGLDLHADAVRLEGVIGFVPQDDLLFEDLTVFENLYYNACLCMANLDSRERASRVDALLEEMNQLQARDLKVGTPIDKTISGGQR